MMSKVHLTLFRLNNNINTPLVPPPHTAPRLASLKVSSYRLLELSIRLREISQWLQKAYISFYGFLPQLRICEDIVLS